MRRQEDKEVESRRRKESRAATVSVRLSAANQIPNPPGLRQGGKVSITMFYLLLALINNKKVLSIFFQQERLLHYLKGIETTSNTLIWLRLKLQSTFSTSNLLSHRKRDMNAYPRVYNSLLSLIYRCLFGAQTYYYYRSGFPFGR